MIADTMSGCGLSLSETSRDEDGTSEFDGLTAMVRSVAGSRLRVGGDRSSASVSNSSSVVRGLGFRDDQDSRCVDLVPTAM